MSTEAVAAPLGRRRPRTLDLRSARILRYAVGVTATTAIAFGLAWPLFFLTPVLTAVFLAMPLPAPSLRGVVRNVVHVLAAFTLGMLMTVLLLPFPLVYVPALGLVLFHIYYLANRGGSPWLVLVSLLAVILLPMLGITHGALAWGVAVYFIVSSMVAAVAVYAAYRVVPDPPGAGRRPPARERGRGYSPQAARRALTSTLAILPLAVFFLTMNLSGQLLVLIYAAIFSMSADLSRTRVAGASSLVSTLIGGVTALIVYWLIVAVPELHFFVALIFLVMLVMGAGIFSDSPRARLLSSASTATLVLLGSAMGDDVNLSGDFLVRVVLTLLATLYVVCAIAVIERFSRPAAVRAGG